MKKTFLEEAADRMDEIILMDDVDEYDEAEGYDDELFTDINFEDGNAWGE